MKQHEYYSVAKSIAPTTNQKRRKMMNKIKITYKKAIKAHAVFTAQLQLLEKEFVFTGFSECEPHVDYVHNDIFLAWEDVKEGVIHELSIEEAIDEMCQNGCITPDLFAI